MCERCHTTEPQDVHDRCPVTPAPANGEEKA